ncbi:MAG: B12-binding domain-containing radical SAM protein, partial [Verrucomicrobiota bacterium]
GGGMFTSWRKRLREAGLRSSPFHAVGFGPGESVLAAAAAGTLPPGERYLEGGEDICFSPDYGFAELPAYLSPEPVLPVAASRGCYWRKCAFCPEAVAPASRYRSLEAGRFPALLRELSRRHGVSRFHLTDDAIPPAVLRAIADRGALLAGLSWHGFARFEPILLDSGFVSALRDAGCTMLQLGLESGSQGLLDRLGKGTRVADASRILANLSRAGIGAYVYVMLGAPGETRGDAEATVAFLEEHAERIGFLNLSILNLPRDARMPADGEAPYDGNDALGLYRPVPEREGWGRGASRRFLQKELFGRLPIRAIAARTPPWFTSNHAPFFCPGRG